MTTNRRRSMLEQEGGAGEFGSNKGSKKESKTDLLCVIDLYRMFEPLLINCKCFMNSKIFIIELRLIFVGNRSH